MWTAHGFGFGAGHGASGAVAEVALFLLLLLHSLAYVLLFERPGSGRHRLVWAPILLVPLAGPVTYLVAHGLRRAHEPSA